MPGRSRLAAVVATIALFLAAPFERGRSCDVCPVDCPMHASGGKAKHLGCHQGSDVRPPAPPVDDGACAMRASCGHHKRAIVATFDGELSPVVIAAPLVATGRVRIAACSPVLAEKPAPPHRPPEPSVV